MPRECRPIILDGKQVGFACGSRRRMLTCSATGCTNPGDRQCDYQVTRKGKAGTCDAHRVRWARDDGRGQPRSLPGSREAGEGERLMGEDLALLKAKIDAMSMADRLRLAAALIEAGREELAHAVAERVVLELGAAQALQRMAKGGG